MNQGRHVSPQVGECNPYANWGCTSWEDGKRGHDTCKDKVIGIMPWAEKPVRTDEYSLRAGNGELSADATSYVPGENLDVFLTVKKRDSKFRGLLVTPYDATNKTVCN